MRLWRIVVEKEEMRDFELQEAQEEKKRLTDIKGRKVQGQARRSEGAKGQKEEKISEPSKKCSP